MLQVDRCTNEDLPAVARLHARVFHGEDGSPSPDVHDYYRTVFFENPWIQADVSSLVVRAGDRLIGFLGVLPRPMLMDGKEIWAAVAHRLMVDPEAREPLAAPRLCKALFAGPQDLSISDGANDLGRRFWCGAGGSLAHIYSLRWLYPLRPLSHLAHPRIKRPSALVAGNLIRPLARAADAMMSRFLRKADVGRTNVVETDDDTLREHFEDAARSQPLRARYDRESWSWVLGQLRADPGRGRLRCLLITSSAGQPLGTCAYLENPGAVSEVMLIAAKNRRAIDPVVSSVAREAYAHDSLALEGRLEPWFMQHADTTRLRIRQGLWTLVHSRDPSIVDHIYRGDAFLSCLDGELCLRSPMRLH